MIKFVPLKAEGPLELRPEDRAQISATLAKLTGPDSALPSDQQAKIDALRARITEKNGTINAEERAELKQIINSAVADKMRTAMKHEDRAKLKAALARIQKAPPASPPPPDSSQGSLAPGQIAGKTPSYPWQWSAGVLAGLSVLSLWVLTTRVRSLEVIELATAWKLGK